MAYEGWGWGKQSKMTPISYSSVNVSRSLTPRHAFQTHPRYEKDHGRRLRRRLPAVVLEHLSTQQHHAQGHQARRAREIALQEKPRGRQVAAAATAE